MSMYKAQLIIDREAHSAEQSTALQWQRLWAFLGEPEIAWDLLEVKQLLLC